MKSIIALLVVLPHIIMAQEYERPTAEDLLAVSFNFLEESKKALQPPLVRDCDDAKTATKIQTAAAPEAGEEIICLCELDDKREGVLETLFGEIKSQEITVTTGNDNFLHGVLQISPDTAKYDGDDRGRTFGVRGDYRLLGDKGEFKLSLDSTGFSKFSQGPGGRRDPDGKYYLNYNEVNTLDLGYNRIHQSNEKGRTYSIYEFNLTHRTDNGFASRDLQNWWHHLHSDPKGLNMIRYHYLQEESDKTTARIMAGVGKEWITQIDKWKCITKAELKGGFTAAKSGMSPEIAAKAGLSLTHSSVKWIALSGWLQAGAGYGGKSYERGLNISFPIKGKNYSVEPFIGIERHRTELDRAYGGTKGKAFENYHVFGVTIRY